MHDVEDVKSKGNIAYWTNVIGGFLIRNPEGFDKEDSLMWEREMTIEEFTEGLLKSSCIYKQPPDVVMDRIDELKVKFEKSKEGEFELFIEYPKGLSLAEFAEKCAAERGMELEFHQKLILDAYMRGEMSTLYTPRQVGRTLCAELCKAYIDYQDKCNN